MFVDACAIVSMMAGEDTADSYEAALLEAASPFTSTPAAWEAIIVLSRPDQLNCPYNAAEAVVVEWLEARRIALREPGSPLRVLSYVVAVAETRNWQTLPQQFRSGLSAFTPELPDGGHAIADIRRNPKSP